MIKTVEQEVEKIIKELKLNCSIKEFKDKVIWEDISKYQKLSESFIREFQDKVSWEDISKYQKLSESFIREFKNRIKWRCISYSQKLSESFIKEFKDKVEWYYISSSQKLSESFIREFEDKVNWNRISSSQKLSESFIREFKDKVYWNRVSEYQKLSESFIRKFKDKINKKLYKAVNRKISYQQKLKEVKEYCKKYNLEFDYKNRCFYAYREHDIYNRGIYNKTISYKKNKYYKDWHLDMRKKVENSFGLGIFPKGNTKVKVLIKDWGVSVNRKDGKSRVWGFEIV